MNPTLQDCLTASPEVAPLTDLPQWRQRWLAVCAQTTSPIERAIGIGFSADCLAWAFLGGYQAALRLIDASLQDSQMASFCVTEEGGNRPANIQTTWRELPDGRLQIDGQKSWLALAQDCDVLLVAARRADIPDVQIALIRVPLATAGVSINQRTDIPMIPEVPHARARLDGVRVPLSSLMPGDGYAQFVKPFRTMEDIHVTAGLLSFTLRQARRLQWPDEFIEQTVAAIAALSALAILPASEPMTHIELSGVLHNITALIEQADKYWESTGDRVDRMRWSRDCKLLSMANKVRQLRTQRAWQTVR